MTRIRKKRVIIIIGVIAIWMLSMGCWVAELWDDMSDSNFWEYEGTDAIKATITPERYYDTEESDMVFKVEETAEGEKVETPIVGDELILFDNQNILAVYNGGTSPTFEVQSATLITKIRTYHWNDAVGHSSTGTISLQADNGTVYGPWATVGAEGQGGVPNAYWAASPNVTIPAGRYTVIDSDPSTWSQNADSGGVGFAIVYGQVAE